MKIFDSRNPWHVNADFMFGFQCDRCENQISLDDATSDDYAGQCVEMSEKAQDEGWVYLDDFSFMCQSCAERDKAR